MQETSNKLNLTATSILLPLLTNVMAHIIAAHSALFSYSTFRKKTYPSSPEQKPLYYDGLKSFRSIGGSISNGIAIKELWK